MADDGDEDEHAGRRVEAEREPDPEPVDEAVDREPEGAERADLGVGAGLLGVVAVMQDEHAARRGRRPMKPTPTRSATRCASSTASMLSGQDVEQRDRDHHPSGERHQGRQRVGQPQRNAPPAKVATTVTQRERDRDPLH